VISKFLQSHKSPPNNETNTPQKQSTFIISSQNQPENDNPNIIHAHTFGSLIIGILIHQKTNNNPKIPKIPTKLHLNFLYSLIHSIYTTFKQQFTKNENRQNITNLENTLQNLYSNILDLDLDFDLTQKSDTSKVTNVIGEQYTSELNALFQRYYNMSAAEFSENPLISLSETRNENAPGTPNSNMIFICGDTALLASFRSLMLYGSDLSQILDKKISENDIRMNLVPLLSVKCDSKTRVNYNVHSVASGEQSVTMALRNIDQLYIKSGSERQGMDGSKIPVFVVVDANLVDQTMEQNATNYFQNCMNRLSKIFTLQFVKDFMCIYIIIYQGESGTIKSDLVESV